MLQIFEIIKTALAFLMGLLRKSHKVADPVESKTDFKPTLKAGTLLSPVVELRINHPGSSAKLGRYKDRPGTVKFVSGNFKVDLDFWCRVRNFANKYHYSRKEDNPLKVDLGFRDSKYMAWWGPAANFKIDYISIGNTYHGSRLVLIVEDGRKSRILFVHLVEINHDLLQGLTQNKDGRIVTFSGNGPSHAAGTYLGRTNGIIGCMSGPHLHMKLLRGGTHRRHLQAILKG